MALVGVSGIGFVGDALVHGFSQKGVDLCLYDKYKDGGVGRIRDLLDCWLVFLCLPTLYCQELQRYDTTALEQNCQYLSQNRFKGIVVIKSTVEPGTSQQLADKYSLKIVHNPEFLTARTARLDFLNQDHIVLGKTNSRLQDGEYNRLLTWYQELFPDAEISICTSGESESMKIMVNSFYAVKVQLFNEFHLLSMKTNDNFEVIKEMMLKNGWINPQHTNVPGPDGRLSYGGACFPKDTSALLKMMKRLETPCAVLEGCVNERNQMRGD